MAAWSDHGARRCPHCDGTGKLTKPPIVCPACNGTGVVAHPDFGVSRRLFFVVHKLLEMDDSGA
jgi:uncharacterized phage protein